MILVWTGPHAAAVIIRRTRDTVHMQHSIVGNVVKELPTRDDMHLQYRMYELTTEGPNHGWHTTIPTSS